MGNWPSISLVLRVIAPALKTAWFGSSATETSSTPSAREDAAQLAQRPGRDVGLQLAADPALQLGPLDREPVGVGRDHRHLAAGGGDQDAGQHRAHVVARGGAGDQVDGRGQGAGRDLQRLALLLGELREVLGGQDPQVEARAAAADLHVALRLAHLDLHRRVAERAGDFGQEAAGQQDRALAGDLGLEAPSAGPSRGRSRKGSRPSLRRSGRIPGERLSRGAGGNGAGDDGELGDEFFALSGELQVVNAFLSWIRTCGNCLGHGRFGLGVRFAGCGGGCGNVSILTVPSAVRRRLRRGCGLRTANRRPDRPGRGPRQRPPRPGEPS